MNRLIIAAIAASLYGCSSYEPDAGHEIVTVEKPAFFGHGGIDPEPVKVGRSYGAFTTDGIDVYMQPQKFETVMPDTMTSDGVPIEFHAIMVIQVVDSVALIKNFGEKWYENNLSEQFKTMVRNAVRKHGMNETAISTKALDVIDGEIKDNLIAFITEKNLPIKLITMTVGRANPPDAIKHQRIETAAQEQRIQTEMQIKLAEDQRKLAEQSRAEADQAYRNGLSLSAEQYVQLKNIEMQKDVCIKGGCTFVINGAAVATLPVK